MRLEEVARKYAGLNEGDNSFRVIIDLYNTLPSLPRGYAMTYDDAWCMAFASACAWEAGFKTTEFPYECSCMWAVSILKNMGLWVEEDDYIPEPGDLVFYSWSDDGNGDCLLTPNHVGIVDSVYNGYFTTWEGNYNNAVAQRKVAFNSKFIRGFGHIKQEGYGVTETTYTDDEIVKQVIAGKWGNGTDRKENLERFGYDYYYIQSLVNEYLSNNSVIGSATKTAEEVATAVIRGEYGNGAERISRLEADGYDYVTIQKLVNEMLENK